MGIFDQVVDAIVDEMELPRDGESILRKAAENPEDFDYLAVELSVPPDAVRQALDKDPATLTVETFAADLGVEPDDVTRVLWAKARFREDMEADSLDLVGLIMSFESLAEDEYGLVMEIPDEEAQKIGTVEEAVAYLEKVLDEAGVEV